MIGPDLPVAAEQRTITLADAGDRTRASVADSDAPAFVVAENDVIDADAYKDYAGRVLSTLIPFGGVVMARAGESVSLEGAPPGRIVLIRFDSLERAKAWWESDAYKAIVPLRLKAAVGRVYVVQGSARVGGGVGQRER